MASKYFKIGQFIRNLAKGGKQKTTGTEVISSVPVSESVKKYGIKHSVAKTRLDESSKRSAQVDKNYKTMKEAKKAFKDAKADLQKMVDTGRAQKINKRVFRKGVKYDSDALFPTKKRNEGSKKLFEASKGRKFNKGGRVGLKSGTNLGMQSVKYGLDNKPEITKLDRIAKFIAKDKKKKNKTPMDKTVRKA